MSPSITWGVFRKAPWDAPWNWLPWCYWLQVIPQSTRWHFAPCEPLETAKRAWEKYRKVLRTFRKPSQNVLEKIYSIFSIPPCSSSCIQNIHPRHHNISIKFQPVFCPRYAGTVVWCLWTLDTKKMLELRQFHLLVAKRSSIIHQFPKCQNPHPGNPHPFVLRVFSFDLEPPSPSRVWTVPWPPLDYQPWPDRINHVSISNEDYRPTRAGWVKRLQAKQMIPLKHSISFVRLQTDSKKGVQRKNVIPTSDPNCVPEPRLRTWQSERRDDVCVCIQKI